MEILILVVLVLAIIRGEYNRKRHIKWAWDFKATTQKAIDVLERKINLLDGEINGKIMNAGIDWADEAKGVEDIKKEVIAGEGIRINSLVFKTKGLKELVERMAKENVENSIELNKRFGDLDKFVKLLKANLPPEVFDFTKKTRGWKAEWKITAKDKKDIETMEGTQEEIAEKYKISRERVGQIKRAYRLRIGIKK